jgi:tetratricopeptide (TPR) repeat protein
LKQENIQTVVDICRKVDGIPLAIELAAARVNILQIDEILNQLNNSFTLLVSDGRTILPRHQTIQASLDWSWSLLDEKEQNFLRQLFVFAGGWTLESAQAVCAGEVLGLTGSLVNKSLVVVNQETGRETRYRFHEMVRQYVHAKFVGSDDKEIIRDRHLKYFLEFSEKAEMDLRGRAHTDWMERLDVERNNIRVALHWADKTDVEAGLYISGRLMRYWESSNVPEGNQWLKIFIDKQNANDFPRAKACALHTYGWLLTWLQKFEDAHTMTEECLALYRSVDDQAGEADALVSLGNIYQFQDDMKKANELEKKALKISQSLKDPWREGNALTYLGWGYSEPEVKFGYWEKAIRLYRETGDHIQLANLLGLFGQFKVMNGEIETGEKHLDEALELWRSNKKANVWENPKIAKSLIALIYGRYEEAQAILEEVLHSSEQSGNRMAVLWAKVRMGYVAFHAGNMTEARELLSNSARDFAKDDYTSGNLFALEGLAGLDATLGKPDRAARLIGYADATRERVSETRHIIEQADVDMSIAACKARMGDSAFEETYNEGKKMVLGEAMELALTQ